MSALAAAFSISLLSPASPHVVNQLPMPAWAYGAIALGLVIVLLLFTWMFRHSAAAMIEGEHGRRGGGHTPGAGASDREGSH